MPQCATIENVLSSVVLDIGYVFTICNASHKCGKTIFNFRLYDKLGISLHLCYLSNVPNFFVNLIYYQLVFLLTSHCLHYFHSIFILIDKGLWKPTVSLNSQNEFEYWILYFFFQISTIHKITKNFTKCVKDLSIHRYIYLISRQRTSLYAIRWKIKHVVIFSSLRTPHHKYT